MDISKDQYRLHKKTAGERGIAFDLTFDEWKNIWGEHMARRGRGADQLGMLRTRDEGGYAVGNVRLGTPQENAQEHSVVKQVSRAQNWRHGAGKYYVKPPAQTSWVTSRNYVFDEYVENEETA